ncbi:hypothetical protein SUGI_0330940 [Cryptomeria japonica]|nr:hypothetical protein SUGI_0330940 [Cryptomeria japonica]
MAATEGSRSGSGYRSRDTDVRSSGVQAVKIGSWSDEADIAFPTEADQERNLDFRRWTFLPHRPRHPKLVRKNSRPTIFLDENKINSARSNLLEFCFFIKWGGGKRVKDNFESWCRAQWGNDININILPNDFYMIEFMSNEEKWQAKNKGPYILDGIEVHIIDWQPNFNPQTHVLPDSKVWIRFYNCPSDYWHIDVIKDIYKDLGTFVSVDDILEDKYGEASTEFALAQIKSPRSSMKSKLLVLGSTKSKRLIEKISCIFALNASPWITSA